MSKRRHLDSTVARRRLDLWLSMHPGVPRQLGRFRKHSIGCRVTQCQLCHGYKYPRRVPTRREKQVDDFARRHPND